MNQPEPLIHVEFLTGSVEFEKPVYEIRQDPDGSFRLSCGLVDLCGFENRSSAVLAAKSAGLELRL